MHIPSFHLPSLPISHRKKTLHTEKEPRTAKKQNKWFYAVILLLLLCIGLAMAFFLRNYFASIRVPAETRVNEGLNNSIQAETYRFSFTSKLIVEGKEKLFSVIQGEKGNNNCYHIQGTILGTAVNIYQIGDTTYRQDPIDHKWIVIEKNNMEKESMLISELNPISNFYFNEIGPITALEKSKEENKLGMKYGFRPELENHWMEEYFDGFAYEIWITRKAPYYLEKAKIEGSSKKNNANKLHMEIEFSDFNTPISIQQPVLK